MVEVQRLLFNLNAVAPEKEDFREVVKELRHNCQDCRLGLLNEDNHGLIIKGNWEAKLAFISEMPGTKEMECGEPLSGPSGKVFERWARYLNINSREDCFVTNVVQCKPPDVLDKKDRQLKQRAPDATEIAACFGPRALRLLRAMPNLDCVVCLGWVAAKALLGPNPDGTDPKSKTHENMWFGTSLLPGIPIYCLVHPSFLRREENKNKGPSPEIVAKVTDGLDKLRREYLDAGKTRAIAKRMAAEREASLLL